MPLVARTTPHAVPQPNTRVHMNHVDVISCEVPEERQDLGIRHTIRWGYLRRETQLCVRLERVYTTVR